MNATSSRRIGGVGRGAGYAAALAVALSVGSTSLAAQGPRVALDRGEIEARIWLDRGDQPLLDQGDQVRVYYRAAEDAYVAIFHIDTDGTATLAFPHSPDEDHYARGGRDYRLLFPRSPYWFVEDAPGVGYFFIVASPEPFDLSTFRYSRYDRGWDLSAVGRQVYRDPYVAMDDYIAALLPDWQSVPYGLDFVSYDVGSRHQYPRFLCYQCHAFRSYAAWNPYYSACTNFRVVIYDDPYFYPARRYRGDRVVWAQPPRPYYSRYDFRARAVGEPSRAIVAPRPPSEPTNSLRPAVAPRRDPANGAGGVVAPSNAPTNLGTIRGRPTAPQPSTAQPREGAQPAQRRPSDGARGGVASPGTSGPSTTAPSGNAVSPSGRARPQGPTVPPDSRQRPVLERRPSEGSSQAPTSTPTPSTRGNQPSSGNSGGAERPSSESPQSQPPQSGDRPTGPTTRPPTSPAPSGDGRRAQPRPSGESGQSSPPPSSSGTTSSGSSNNSGSSGEQPTVRRTPDGRPVVR